MTVNGAMIWTFATLGGTGALNANGGITINGDTFSKTLSQRTLNNAGVATFGGTGSLAINQNAVWNNLPGSLFVIQNTAPIGSTVGPPGTFTNHGTLRKSGAGTSSLGVALENEGIIEVQVGTLALNAGCTGSGDIDVAASCSCTLNGTSAINPGASLTGAGTLTVAGGTTTFTHAPTGSGNLAVTGGVANFNGDCGLGSITLTGGALGGSGDITVTGPMFWTFANLGGTSVLNANGGITMSGDSFSKTLSQRTLNNAGVATFTGTSPLAINQNAVWNNLSGSTFEIQNTASIGFTVGPAGTFNNGGILRKSSTGISNIAIGLSNPGTIDVDAGTLNITSTLSNFSGTTLTGGTYDISGILRFPGANIVTNAAVIILDGAGSAIQNSAGVDALSNFSTNATTGSFQIKNGRNFARTGAFNNAGQVRIGPGASVLSATGNYLQTAGMTVLDNATLDPTPSADFQAGDWKGNGMILSNVINAGTCKVGLSPGSISISGDYTQTTAGTLEAEIGGLTPGVGGFDQLLVGGSATLAGTLNVALFGGFEPNVGDGFDIVSAASRVGAFETTNLPLPFSQNCKGEPQYGPTFVRINTYAQVAITDQPDSQAICSGDPVTFAVVADGTGPLAYQWRKAGMDIPGATGSSFTDPDVQPADSGIYDVIITNVCGFENSAAAVLTVQVAPDITDHADSQTVCAGANVVFSIAATAIPAPGLQWRRNTIDLPNETAPTLVLANIHPADAGSYDCVATNVCGTATSDPALLTVNTAPGVILHPVAAHVCRGGGVQFSVEVTGSPAPSLQWQRNGIDLANGGNISGANSTTVTLAPVSLADAGMYACMVSNACLLLASDGAALVVHAGETGDLNNDLLVNGGDITGFVAAILSGGPPQDSYCAADFNSDGLVDMSDLGLFLTQLVAP